MSDGLGFVLVPGDASVTDAFGDTLQFSVRIADCVDS